jgi:hypothetical protein
MQPMSTPLPAIAAPAIATHPDRSAIHLRRVAQAWFAVAALGQLLFLAYILGAYGLAAVRGDFAAWNAVMPGAWVAGADGANLLVAMHLAFATLVIGGGVLQLLPPVRRRWPVFHRWNGRVYLATVALMCGAGLVMLATREPQGEPLVRVGLAVSVALVLGFAWQALRHARARRFDQHRRYVLRLFLTVSAAWTFRIGLMFWLVVNQGPVGFDPQTFRGPFLVFLAFAQYLLPLALLELYFLAGDRGSVWLRRATAAVLAVATLATAVGIAAASAMLWLPKL